MAIRPAVLVVDDEAPMRKFLSANLKARGYEVLVAADGSEALKIVAERSLDVLILDLGIPGPDGFAVLAAVRHESGLPVIVLSARGRERDKVKALDLGADDYITKPFGVEELMARVRVALRHAAGIRPATCPSYQFEGLEIDFDARRVRREGAAVVLTPKEYELLTYLARSAGKVLTHRQILQGVWGAQYVDETDYLWTYVRRIRRKIEADPTNPRYVRTEAGVGYSVPEPTRAGIYA